VAHNDLAEQLSVRSVRHKIAAQNLRVADRRARRAAEYQHRPIADPGSVPVNDAMDSEEGFNAAQPLRFGAANTVCALDLGT
jgi:hypothetical protein